MSVNIYRCHAATLRLYGMLVENEHAVRLKVVIARESIAGEKVVHGFVELDPQWRALVVEQKIHLCIVLLAHADLDIVRDLEERMKVA